MRKTSLVLAVLLAAAGICVMLWPMFTGHRLQADTNEAVQNFLEERKPEQQYPELMAALQEYMTGPGRYLQHPCRADQAVRMLDRCTDLARLRRLAAGPNAHNANMRHAPKRKPRTESRDRL